VSVFYRRTEQGIFLDRKPVSTGISHESFGAEDNDLRNTLYKDLLKSCLQFIAVLKSNKMVCLVNTITVASKWANAWILAEMKGSCQHCVAPKSEKAAGKAYGFNSTECYVTNCVSETASIPTSYSVLHELKSQRDDRLS